MAPSIVWKHFVKRSKDDAKCRICFSIVKTSKNTSNLWAHLHVKHGITSKNNKEKRSESTGAQDQDLADEDPDDVQPVPAHTASAASTSTSGGLQYPSSALTLLGNKRKSAIESGASPPKQRTLAESLHRAASFKEGGALAAELDDAFLFMLMRDNMPLRSGDKEGMRYFAKKSVPLWSPPGRNKITRMMEAKYGTLFDLVKSAIGELPSVCLTADCWTESHNNTSFLGVTCHFPIDNEMESVVLGLKELTESHTSQYLASKIEETLEAWSITNPKVSLIVTDNAANITAAVRSVFGNDRILGCFDHSLNLVPRAALSHKKVDNVLVSNVPGIMELIGAIKEIVGFYHRSTNFSNEVKRIQRERGLSEGQCLHLLQDVVTRWGSTWKMLDRFLAMSDIVTLAALKFPNEVTMLSASQLATLKIIRDILKPFQKATQEMSAEKVTTASTIIPVVALIRKQLMKIDVPRSDDIANRFLVFIINEFNRRFEHIENVMPIAIATLVDPRYLKIYFQNPVAVARARSIIEEELKKHIRKDISAATEAVLATESTAAPSDTNEEADDDDLWAPHKAMVTASYVAHTGDDIGGKARTELRAFLDRIPAPRDSNPLKTWESIRHEYPSLYKVAQRFLPAVGTSVPVERFFSECGKIMTDDSNRLSAEHLDQRVFLSKINLRMWEALTK